MIWNHTQHCIWQGAWDCPQQSLSYTSISRQYLRLNDRTKLYCVGGPCAVNCCRDVMAAAAAEAMMGGDAATTLNCVWLMAVLAGRYVIWWPVNHCRTKFSRAVRRFGTYSCKLCGLDWLSGNLSSLSVYVFVLHWLHMTPPVYGASSSDKRLACSQTERARFKRARSVCKHAPACMR